MKYFSIGKVKIKKTAALAPMASVADRAYRTLCREYGACYTVSELISAKGLCYNDKKTAELCTRRRTSYGFAALWRRSGIYEKSDRKMHVICP